MYKYRGVFNSAEICRSGDGTSTSDADESGLVLDLLLLLLCRLKLELKGRVFFNVTLILTFAGIKAFRAACTGLTIDV